jgi:hypothetical protein
MQNEYLLRRRLTASPAENARGSATMRKSRSYDGIKLSFSMGALLRRHAEP